MNIVVCLKQVPDTAQVRIDPGTHTLIRTGVESIINPYDRHALEEAVRLVEKYGGAVVALTMGPPQAESALREALACGAHRAILLSDRVFGGADTWATSFTLAKAVRHGGIFPEPIDLILCGKQAVDGDTAQVGPAMAEHLDLPLLPYVRKIRELRFCGAPQPAPRNVTRNEGRPAPGNTPGTPEAILVECLDEDGVTVFESPLPAVLTVVKELNVPRRPSLASWYRAREAPVETVDNGSLGLPPDSVGLRGSPTRVKRIEGVSYEKKTVLLSGGAEESARLIGDLLLATTGQVAGTAGAGHRPATEAAGDEESPALSAAGPEPLKEPAAGPPVLVIGEIRNGKIHSSTYELVSKANELAAGTGGASIVILPGYDSGRHGADATPGTIEPNGSSRPSGNGPAGLSYTELPPADRVYFVDIPEPEAFESGAYTDALLPVIETEGPAIILGAATYRGRALLPRLAARLKTGLTADCTELEIDAATGLLLQRRPAFGGNVLATIVCSERSPQMATIRPGAMAAAGQAARSGGSRKIITRSGFIPGTHRYPRIVSRIRGEDSGSLLDARILISGGKGIGSAAGFDILRRVADLTGGSLGASRAAVEAGWIPYSHQVGQTGRTVQPDIYLACGISGSVQHLVGMQSSGTVVAINTDPEAPILQVADYAAVADYRILLPVLAEYLEESVRKRERQDA